MSLQVGDRSSVTRTFSSGDVAAFGELTGDLNPLHFDEGFAASTRFGRPIVHGMLTASLISAAMTALGAPVAYVGQDLRFTAPVFPGDTVTATAEVIEVKAGRPIAVVRTTCVKQTGQVVVEGTGALLLLAPAPHPNP